jgi:hypothetical protein
MMSSEEDTDCFGLYGDKLLKKNKRSRQRVDAGEPRNSYSSIPNFSSRPSLMSGGLYGAIFSQNQQHFGLFPSGYGPAKMLNELLGRQVNSNKDAAANNNENIMLDSPTGAGAGASAAAATANLNSVKLEFDSQNIIKRGSGKNSVGGSVFDLDENSGTPPQANDLAHHMLRNILQGKKDLIALDQELRNSSSNMTSNHNGDRHTPDNNNTILSNKNTNLINNNNNNILNNNYESKGDNNNLNGGDVSDCSELGVSNSNINKSSNPTNNANPQQVATSDSMLTNCSNQISNSNSQIELNNSVTNSNSSNHNNNNNNNKIGENSTSQNNDVLLMGQELLSNSNGSGRKDSSELMDEDMMINSLPDSNHAMLPESPGSVKLKEEILDGELNSEKDLNCRSPSPLNSNKSEHAMELKRARVENIVSSMRSSPALPNSQQQQQQVNGCKKRKLYHPQQHDNSALERYAATAASLNLGLNLQSLMLADDDEEEDMVHEQQHLHQKRVEKDVLKSQLRSMQEQLAEMQQKYVQLCNRMEQSSDAPEDGDDNNSDLNDDDLMRDNDVSGKPSPSHVQRTPTASPIKEIPNMPKSSVSNAQNMISQMMSKMISAKLGHLGPHPSMPPFNGTHPLLQHIQQQQQQNAEGLHNPHMQHPHPHAFSNAAAMYLSQKLLMEQEARLAKEAEERNQQQMLQQQQQQQQQQVAQAQMVQQQKQQAEHQMQMAQAAQNKHHHEQQQQQLEHFQRAQHMQQNAQQPPMTPNNPIGIPPMKTSPPQMSAGGPHSLMTPKSNMPSELSDRLSMMRTQSIGPLSGTDLEGLADVLKTEITASLSNLVDSIVTRFMHQRRFLGKQSEAAAAAAEQLNKDLLMASQILDRKSPRTKVTATSNNNNNSNNNPNGGGERANSNQSGNTTLSNTNSNLSSSNNNANNNLNNTNNNHPSANTMSHVSPANLMSSSQSNNTNHSNNINQNNASRMNGQAFPPPPHHPHQMGGMPGMHVNPNAHDPNNLNSLNLNPLNLPTHLRPSPTAAMFQPPKPPQNPMNSVAAAALYNSISALNGQANPNNPMNPFCMPEPRDQPNEQNEALSLVVTPKKKRHKVTDTRITPRTVSRILAQDALGPPPNLMQEQNGQNNQGGSNQTNLAGQNLSSQNSSNNSQNNNNNNSNGPNNNVGQSNNKSFSSTPINGVPSSLPAETPSPRPTYHPPPSMLPVSLPTSVAIPNPSLHESQVFSPYSPFFNPHGPHGPHGPQSSQFNHMAHHMSSSPPGIGALMDPRDSPPLPHPPTMLHPALLAAAHHGGSPDYGHIRAAMDANDRNSDCNSGDINYDGMQPTISFSNLLLNNIK